MDLFKNLGCSLSFRDFFREVLFMATTVEGFDHVVVGEVLRK